MAGVHRTGGNVISARWQVTLSDPMWHVSSCSGVATLQLYACYLLTYAEKLLAGVRFDDHSSVFITFIIICVNQVQVFRFTFLPVIPTLSVSMFISASVRFLVLLSFTHILDVSLSVSGRLFVDSSAKLVPCDGVKTIEP